MNQQGATEKPHNILVFGAGGTIGAAVLNQLAITYPAAHITGVSRRVLDPAPTHSNLALHDCDYGSVDALTEFSTLYATQHDHIDQLLVTS